MLNSAFDKVIVKLQTSQRFVSSSNQQYPRMRVTGRRRGRENSCATPSLVAGGGARSVMSSLPGADTPLPRPMVRSTAAAASSRCCDTSHLQNSISEITLLFSISCCLPGTLHQPLLKQEEREAQNCDEEGQTSPRVLPVGGHQGQDHDA